MAPPHLALGGEQPVPQHRPEQALDELALDVILLIGQQNLLDIVRLDDEKAVEKQQLVIDQIAAEDFRREDRELIVAHPAEKFQRAILRRDMGVFDNHAATIPCSFEGSMRSSAVCA